jgi:aspartyl-tRNA(Asn)/glutamyl-tRNA(Gln) amidotransferase subunit C
VLRRTSGKSNGAAWRLDFRKPAFCGTTKRALQGGNTRCYTGARFHYPDQNMSVDPADVRRIARLARIAVEDDEIAFLRDEINAILAFVEQLDRVDVTGIEAMTSVTPMKLPMREDVVDDGEIASKILANAPQTEDGFFLVPKVIE